MIEEEKEEEEDVFLANLSDFKNFRCIPISEYLIEIPKCDVYLLK